MTLTELRATVQKKLDEDAAQSFRWYPDSDIDAALNDAQVVHATLTLCVEAQVSIPCVAGTAFYPLFSYEPRAIVVLRATDRGVRLTPDRVQRFRAVDNSWRNNVDTPLQYAVVGSNLVGLRPPPSSSALTMALTVARCPDPISGSPAIPAEDHYSLAEYAVWFLETAREGASEKANQCLARFFECVSNRIEQVRSRAKANSYDAMPIAIDQKKIQAIVGGASERRNRRE